MMSSSDWHYVVRYCAGSVVYLYGVVVRLALAGQILVWFSRRSLCCHLQIDIIWSDSVQVQS